MIAQAIAWPTAIWARLSWSKRSFREACPLTRFPIRIVPVLLLTNFGAAILIAAVAMTIPLPEFLRKAMNELFAESSALTKFVSFVLFAPVAEELFFRGLVLRGYLSRSSISKAVWASAALFAFFHLNPWQMVGALPLGLFFAWLFLRTGSLLPAILGHAMANFSATFLFVPLGLALGYDVEALSARGRLPPPMLALGVAAVIIGGLILWRQLAGLAPQDETRVSAGESP
jgi:membrane protease YdiL (CAAX protease family)